MSKNTLPAEVAEKYTLGEGYQGGKVILPHQHRQPGTTGELNLDLLTLAEANELYKTGLGILVPKAPKAVKKSE